MIDSALIAAVVATVAAPQIPRAQAVIEAEIGSPAGTSEVVLQRVPDLAADDAGNVYVLDNQANRVHVFSPTGAHLRSFGRRGSGLDELNRPIGIDVHDRTVTVLNPSGSSSSYTLEGDLQTAQAMPFGTQVVRRLAEGTHAVVSWGGLSRSAPVPVESLIVLEGEGPDTILTVPSTDLLFVSPTLTMALPTSLCGLVHIVAGPQGALWVAAGTDGTLTEWRPEGGGFLSGRFLEVAAAGASLPDSTRARLLETLPRQVDPQSGDLYVPSVLSSLCGLERSSGEAIWVRLTDANGRERWREIDTDTLGPTRELLAPEGVALSAFSGGRAYGTRTDDSGFPVVTVYRIE